MKFIQGLQKNDVIFFFCIGIMIACFRVYPHPWNVTPIAALGLFAGAYVPSDKSWLIPVCALLIGDLIIGFYMLDVMIFVYIGFACSALIGRWLLHNQRTTGLLVTSILVNAFIFYLISNFGMWLNAYPQTIEGIIQCYINGLPYLLRSLFGDTFYVFILFGGYELFRQYSLGRNRVNTG